MSRWSAEEDKYILEFIQEVDEDINYPEIVASHNKTFNTKRTEDTYKVRMKKVAKENNINMKSNNHWTEDEKAYILNTIKQNPFGFDMNQISTHLKRSEASIKKMYSELVSPEAHLKCCLSNLNAD